MANLNENENENLNLNLGTVVSIEYIRVNKVDDDKQAVQIYGTVVVFDGCNNDQIVYDRSSNNAESKVPGEYLSLTGPSKPVSAEDPFFISVCLWFHDDDELVKAEEIEGEIMWGRTRLSGDQYDQLLEEEISGGKYGSVSVGYLVLTNAMNATIDIVIINGDRESPVAVYGTIKAFFDDDDDGALLTRMLFDKSANDNLQVSPQQSIPLTYPVFTMGLHSDYLTVAADLWDHVDTSSPDNRIALGSVEFDPVMGTQKKNIIGKYGELQVSFTCFC